MAATKKLLAFAFCAESGRRLLGHFDGVHLYHEVLKTLRRCAAEQGSIDGLGVDTWGVDFALLGRGGTLLGNPRHYRDPHTEGVMEMAFQKVPRAELFGRTC